MTQPYHIVSDEPGATTGEPYEDADATGAAPRDPRVLLRVPDCTVQIAAMARKSRSRKRVQTETDTPPGPWWQLLTQPARWPRIAVAAALGVLVGMVLIVASRETKSWLPGRGDPNESDAARQRQVIRPSGPGGVLPKSTVNSSGVPDTLNAADFSARRDDGSNPSPGAQPAYETSSGRPRSVGARVEGIIY